MCEALEELGRASQKKSASQLSDFRKAQREWGKVEVNSHGQRPGWNEGGSLGRAAVKRGPSCLGRVWPLYNAAAV